MEAFVVGNVGSGLVSPRLAIRVLCVSLAHGCASLWFQNCLSHMRYTGLDNSWSDCCADTDGSYWHADLSNMLWGTISHVDVVVFLCRVFQILVSSCLEVNSV